MLKTEPSLTEEQIAAFWRDGFLIVPGVFSAAEIAGFRQHALTDGDPDRDLLSDDKLRHVVLDSRIQKIACAILGAQPVYFGDSSLSLTPVGSGFHKDNTDRYDASAPDWRTDRYPLMRFGVYFQDHVSAPGGLDLLRGSHMIADPDTGDFVSAQSRLGDVVVWTLRTSHSANSQIFRLGHRRLTNRSPFWRLRHYLKRFPFSLLMVPVREQRMAAFFTLGAESSYLDRYVDYLKTRDYAVASWRRSRMTDDTAALARSVGLGVVPADHILADPASAAS